MNQQASTNIMMRNSSNSGFSIKSSVLLLAKYCGLFALARALTADKTRILAYHGIWLGEGHFGNFLYMSREKFAERMALLEKWGYPVVKFDGKPEGKPRYRCPTVITIDDGWYSTWSDMLPVLEKHGYPATVYLTTYYCLNQAPGVDVALNYCFSLLDTDKGMTLHVPAYDFGPIRIDSEANRKQGLAMAQNTLTSLADDRSRQGFLKSICDVAGVDHDKFVSGRWFHLMTPDEVKDAARRGITFEAHTHHHRITYRGQDCLAEEIATNSECIREMTGRVPVHFCYPSGRFSPDLWPVLESCGIASATTTDIGLVDDKTQPYAMPRVLDGQDVSELEFEAEMSGFMELSRILRRLGRRQR